MLSADDVTLYPTGLLMLRLSSCPCLPAEHLGCPVPPPGLDLEEQRYPSLGPRVAELCRETRPKFVALVPRSK